ncbi:RNA-binding protein 7-like isoform X2 [Pipistrellus kuhlii]|nr:RNA-binding protein 7-like isoform X2 [Pipistrellus kuhlii]
MTPSQQTIQRSFSSPEDFQKQAVMNDVLRQMPYGGKFGPPHLDQSGFSPPVQSHNHNYNQSSSFQWRQDTPASLRKSRQSSHPYLLDRYHSHEQHYRGHRDGYFYEVRNRDGWSHDHDNRRDRSRAGKWH